MELKEKANNLPEVPGVYIMKDFMGNIIYIGKSKDLKKRVSSYFYNNKSHSSKIVQMVNNIDSFEYIRSDTELDALLLESKLIKKHKPIYNRLLKNTKRYLFIKITINETFPMISIVNEKDDDSLYFGPFTSLSAVERSIAFIKAKYPIIQCSTPFSKGKSHCLYYHLGKCIGVCNGIYDNEEYINHVDDIINFLRGRNKKPLDDLKKNMNYASKNMDFNRAAQLRDQLSGLNYVLSKIKVVEDAKKLKNVLVIESINQEKLKIFLIKGNILIDSEMINKGNISRMDFTTQIKEYILKGFSNVDKSIYCDISKEDIDEAQIIHSYLRGKKEDLIYKVIPKSWLDKDNMLDDFLKVVLEKLSSLKGGE